MRHKTVWCDRGWQPVHYAFIPSERALRSELRRLRCDDDVNYPADGGHCVTLKSNGGDGLSCLVMIADNVDQGKTAAGVMSMIVHEATHVWQEIRKHMGEKTPSSEFEAYSMQHICLNLFAAYMVTRRPKFAQPRLPL